MPYPHVIHAISWYFFASQLLYYRYTNILLSEYEYENSKYHKSMISLFLFCHYLVKDKIMIKIFFEPNIYEILR